MYLYLLTGTIFVLLMINLFVFENDLIAPPIIVCAVFLISCICSIYNHRFWQFTIHQNTYITVTCGLALFSIVSFATDKLFKAFHPKPVRVVPSNSTGLNVINIGNTKLALVNAVVFIFSMWYVVETIRIARRYGYVSSIRDITSIYRRVSSYGVLSVENDINVICKQLYKFVIASSYVSLYIFMNNIIAAQKIKGNIITLLPCIIYVVTSQISAGRYQLIKLLSAAIFMYYILYLKHGSSRAKLELKFFFICSVSLVGFCVLFFGLSTVVGRTVDKDPLFYITSYAGGSIPLFDSFLQYPPAKSDIFGKETFFSINSFIGRYFKVEKLQYIIHHEFRTAPTGLNMGNVYTVFRRMIYDFGYGGMIVLYSLCAVFYTVVYNIIKAKPLTRKVDMSIIFYSYISFGLTMQFYEEAFYTSVVSVNTAVTFIMIYICKIFLINITFGKRQNTRAMPLRKTAG